MRFADMRAWLSMPVFRMDQAFDAITKDSWSSTGGAPRPMNQGDIALGKLIARGYQNQQVMDFITIQMVGGKGAAPFWFCFFDWKGTLPIPLLKTSRGFDASLGDWLNQRYGRLQSAWLVNGSLLPNPWVSGDGWYAQFLLDSSSNWPGEYYDIEPVLP